MAGATVEMHAEMSHEVPTDDRCTCVVQDVDLSRTGATLKVCLGDEVVLHTVDW